ncbi:MAG: NAD-dependent epimerase/dehydratase family protein [Verrucomicrobiaceae bacterium]
MRNLSSVLVTGGGGFLGSSVCRQLLARDGIARVVALDKRTDSPGLAKIKHSTRLHLIPGDLLQPDLVENILREGTITAIIHLAAALPSSPPSALISQNVAGTSHLIDAARQAQIPLVTCSIDEVYGPTPVHQKFSETTPLAPGSAVAASYAAADLFAAAAARTHRQDIILTRATNCYGPGQPRHELIPRLVYLALRDQPVQLEGSGRQIRDWMHVDDCALGLIAALELGSRGQIYHLGANGENTDLGLARRILKILHKPESLITTSSGIPEDSPRHALETRRALQSLKWKARIPFRTGLEETVRQLAAELRPTGTL